jgi:hypothetical protein
VGYITYDVLPKYVAVQVSPERWQIATLEPQEGEWKEPRYIIAPTKLTEGQCNNVLTDLQIKERTEK